MGNIYLEEISYLQKYHITGNILGNTLLWEISYHGKYILENIMENTISCKIIYHIMVNIKFCEIFLGQYPLIGNIICEMHYQIL